MNLSRSYLETLSSADLIKLADEHGIDIPDDLNRRFIIGELLEISEEMGSEKHSEMQEVDSPEDETGFLPLSYNETEIDVVLRIPAWAYVWWDISESDFKKATENPDFKNFVLRLSYFDSPETNVPKESFDIQISLARTLLRTLRLRRAGRQLRARARQRCGGLRRLRPQRRRRRPPDGPGRGAGYALSLSSEPDRTSSQEDISFIKV